MDYTGTGNTLNVRHPQVLKLIMDSLRYWVQEMHVDGFRFDLAAALARELHEVDRLSAFFDIINQDPVISQVKLIAEPWDVGEGGYQVGKFPPLWAEWNGKYRDVVRRYWKGDDGQLAELGYRLTGIERPVPARWAPPHRQHQLRHRARRIHACTTWSATTRNTTKPTAKTTATARTTTIPATTARKGPPTTPEIVETRERQKRNFLLTLLLLAGRAHAVRRRRDRPHAGRQQQRLRQDNAISWFDWNLDERPRTLLEFTRRLIRMRRRHPNLHRRKFFQDRRIHPGETERQVNGHVEQDITWLRPDGAEMTAGGVEGGLGALHRLRAERAHAGRRERRGRADPRRDVPGAAESAPRAHPILTCRAARRPGKC